MEKKAEQITFDLQVTDECSPPIGDTASRCCSEASISWISEEESSIGTYDFPLKVKKVNIGNEYSMGDGLSIAECTNYGDAKSHHRSSKLGSHCSPSPWDVVCGQGESHMDHVGNRRLRVLIACYTQRYLQAQKRVDKSNVLKQIVDTVADAGGRFVQHDRVSDAWYDIGTLRAIRHVYHVISYCCNKPKTTTGLLSQVSQIQAIQNDLLYSATHWKKTRPDALILPWHPPKKRKLFYK